MLGRLQWLDCYWLLLKRLNPSLSPAWLLLGEREGSGGVEERPGLGWCCFKKKGTGKAPQRKERAFVLADFPGVAFSCLCGQWQGQQGR